MVKNNTADKDCVGKIRVVALDILKYTADTDTFNQILVTYSPKHLTFDVKFIKFVNIYFWIKLPVSKVTPRPRQSWKNQSADKTAHGKETCILNVCLD